MMPKLTITPLEGKSNWTTWKFKISTLLRMYAGSFDFVEGKLQKPSVPDETADAQVKKEYELNLHRYF